MARKRKGVRNPMSSSRMTRAWMWVQRRCSCRLRRTEIQNRFAASRPSRLGWKPWPIGSKAAGFAMD
jgi:hypothetical protein